MLMLCQEEDEFTKFAEDAGIPLHSCSVELDEELAQVRKDRILTIRQQLAEGTYDLDERLDAILDHFLATLCI
jgi:hypothetical protein